MNSKKITFISTSILIIAFAFAGGVFFGYNNRPAIEKIQGVENKEVSGLIEGEIDFAPFWSAWSVIDSKYVSNNGLDRQKMVWGAIAGLAKSLDDPYTVFFPPQKSDEFKEEMSGNFQGVGMEIGIKDDILTVVAPLKGTPAEKAGIKAGDRIIEIDGETTMDITVEKAVGKIRGEKGTNVVLTILRKEADGAEKITVTRDIIQIPVISTEKLEDGVFLIKFYNFSGNSPVLFEKAIHEFADSGSDKLIVDLRNNPGGFLEAAIDTASWFIPVGDVVAREKFSDGEEKLFRSKGYGEVDNLPFVILVDGGSASASEILAGALSEHGVAKLVGQKTFGKGSVQELVDIPGGGSLKITIARWLTPNGNSISEKGIEPDISVEITKEDVEAEKDPQLEKAIEVLKNWE